MTYKEFIQNILDTRGRFACGEEYHERHHIVPKCMGGNNDESNLIDLYAREHFAAHKLLAEEQPHNYNIQYAWICMGFRHNKNTQERYCLTETEYEELKQLDSSLASERYQGENNPMYGKQHSEETKQLIGNKSKGRYFSEDARRKIGEHSKGRIKSVEEKRKISEKLSGVPKSEEHRKKLSAKAKERGTPVIQITLENEFIRIWKSATLAGNELNIAPTNIIRCCRKRGLKTAGGFKWEYYKEGEKLCF